MSRLGMCWRGLVYLRSGRLVVPFVSELGAVLEKQSASFISLVSYYVDIETVC